MRPLYAVKIHGDREIRFLPLTPAMRLVSAAVRMGRKVFVERLGK